MTIYYENPQTWERVKVGDKVTVLKGTTGTEGHYRGAFLTAERLNCFMDTYSPAPYDTVVYHFYQLEPAVKATETANASENKEIPGKHAGEAYLTGAVIIDQKALSGNIVRIEPDDHCNSERLDCNNQDKHKIAKDSYQ